MKLILTRHGQTIWNTEMRTQGRTDIPLSEAGLIQSGRICARLMETPLNAIYASPLSRAMETASIIAKPHALTPAACMDLLERDFGIWEGESFQDLKLKYPDEIAEWDRDPSSYTPPDAEPLSSVEARIRAFTDMLRSTHGKEDTILIVGHSIPLRLMVSHFIGLAPRHLHAMRLDNTSYTELRVGSRHTMLCTLNDVSHLQGCL